MVTFKGNPMPLGGEAVPVGKPAPKFRVVDNTLTSVTEQNLRGKVTLLSVVPSIDTPVCEKQTKRLHEDLNAFGPTVQFYTVSLDLPFAQKRFCLAHQTDKVTCLSDYQDRTFGNAWGLQMLGGPKLLARAVYVVDKDGIVRYAQVVPEITDVPDYAAAFAAVKRLL
jgi:thiol peroxidase